MKLQYLGDARDAFKWDLLHWICTKSSPSFDRLIFVPMLTPDGEKPNEGNIHHSRFECRNFIRTFADFLRQEPRSINRISTLGAIQNNKAEFQTTIFLPETHIQEGPLRSNYWQSFYPEKYTNSIVFFDPDNGFETKTQKGTKWIGHEELHKFLSILPETSAMVIYQHRPRRTWDDLFADLKSKLETYSHTAIAAYESDIALIAIAKVDSTANRIVNSISSYAEQHPVVQSKRIL